MALSRQQKLVVILLLIYWPSLFVLAHIPIPRLVREAGVSDKGLHFLAYMVLIFLFWSAINPHKKVNWRKPAVWWVLLVIGGYGLIDELLQKCVAGRTCDANDLIANLAGMLTGLALLSVFDFRTTSIVVTGGSIFVLTNLTRVNPADLLPITDTVFHLSAYAFFTLLWIWYISAWPLPRVAGLISPRPRAGGLATAIAAPVGLVLAAKLGSIALGRNFGMRNVIVSTAAIAVVVGTMFLARLYKNQISKINPPDVRRIKNQNLS